MERAEFKLMVHGIDERQRATARDELARLFRIDTDIADDILGAAPIILVRGLTLAQAQVVRRRLRPVAELGVEVVLSNAAYEDCPKVNWPESPEITRVSATEEGATPPEEIATFRCPGCGDTLQLVRIARGQRRRSGRLRPEPAVGNAPAPMASAPSAPSSDPRHVHGFDIPGEVPIAVAEASAEAPKVAAPVAIAEPTVDEGPLVRALQEKRVLRESQRLQQSVAHAAEATPIATVSKVAPPVPPVHAPSAVPPTPEPPTAMPMPPTAMPASSATAGDGPPIDFGDSDAFDHLLLDDQPGAPATAPPASPRREPEASKAPVATPTDAGLDAFDLDEALRLLDDAPLDSAPVGAAPAPAPPARPPSVAVPTAIDLGDLGDLADLDLGGGLDFDDIDSDIAELEAALARGAEDGGDVAEPPPSRAHGSKRPSSGGLEPLDANEALAILGAEGAGSSDDLLLEPAPQPVSSDELVPLDPNEALEILTTSAQRPAVPAKPRIESEPILSVVDDPLPPPKEKKRRKKRKRRDEDKAAGRDRTPAAEAPRRGADGGRKRESGRKREGGRKQESGRKRESGRKQESGRKRESGRAREGAGDERPSGRVAARPVKRGLSARRKAATKRVAADPSDEEPVHGLVLSKITSEAKRQKAAEIISDLTRLSSRDAERLTDRTIIPVLKGVSRQNAEEALRRFQQAKISGRVTTRRLGR